MDRKTEIRIRGLEDRAAMLERHADEREAEAPRMSRLGERSFAATLERMDRDRKKAGQLRAEAARIRRESA